MSLFQQPIPERLQKILEKLGIKEERQDVMSDLYEKLAAFHTDPRNTQRQDMLTSTPYFKAELTIFLDLHGEQFWGVDRKHLTSDAPRYRAGAPIE